MLPDNPLDALAQAPGGITGLCVFDPLLQARFEQLMRGSTKPPSGRRMLCGWRCAADNPMQYRHGACTDVSAALRRHHRQRYQCHPCQRVQPARPWRSVGRDPRKKEWRRTDIHPFPGGAARYQDFDDGSNSTADASSSGAHPAVASFVQVWCSSSGRRYTRSSHSLLPRYPCMLCWQTQTLLQFHTLLTDCEAFADARHDLRETSILFDCEKNPFVRLQGPVSLRFRLPSTAASALRRRSSLQIRTCLFAPNVGPAEHRTQGLVHDCVALQG